MNVLWEGHAALINGIHQKRKGIYVIMATTYGASYYLIYILQQEGSNYILLKEYSQTAFTFKLWALQQIRVKKAHTLNSCYWSH